MSATVLPDRITRLGMEATWEIAALAQSIVEHSPMRYEDPTPLVVRGMAMRIAQLNSRLMAMLSKDLDGNTQDEQERGMALVVVGEAAALAESDLLAGEPPAKAAQQRQAGANMARIVVDSLVSIEEQYLERAGTDKPSDLTLAGSELDIAVQTALTQPDAVRDGFFLVLSALLIGHQRGGFGEDWDPAEVLARHGGADASKGGAA
ncbi:hypothetical protein [Aquabacterium sp.]|uniref:hypothetical protein n=1 Tax=Aquabacterium sp. TaxID=1872578 RepID=UPI003784E833